jgi:hypothetical protein
MSRPALFWGLLMCLLAVLGITVFDEPVVKFSALMFGIGGAMVLLAVVLAVTGLGESRVPAVEALPNLSPSAAATATGVVLAGLGAIWGLWLVYIGAGVVVIGAAGLARELRAQRRSLREAQRR